MTSIRRLLRAHPLILASLKLARQPQPGREKGCSPLPREWWDCTRIGVEEKPGARTEEWAEARAHARDEAEARAAARSDAGAGHGD